jgi:hypothetical protein
MAAIDASVTRRIVSVNGQHRDTMMTLGGTLVLQERKIQPCLAHAVPDMAAWRTPAMRHPNPKMSRAEQGASDASGVSTPRRHVGERSS